MGTRQDVTSASRGWGACNGVIGVLLGMGMLLGGAPPVWAADVVCAEADAQEAVAEAIRKSQEYFTLNTPLERATKAIEAALGCPDADLNFELALVQGLVLLSSGEVTEARAAWARALTNADRDVDRGLIRRLQAHLERQYLPVVFVSREGEAVPVSVQLQSFQPDTLEGEAALASALGEDLEELARGFHRRMIASARGVLQRGNQVPLQVWLPRGTYRLSSGQTLLVQGDLGLTLTVERVRFPERTLLLMAPGQLYRPLDVQAVQMARLGGVGVGLQGFLSLQSDLLLTGQVGFFPMSLWDAPCLTANELNGVCLAGNSPADDTPGEGPSRLYPSVMVGGGVARPVYPHPKVPLLLGVGVRAAWFGDGVEFGGQAGERVVASALAVGVHPGVEALYRFDVQRQPMAVVLGTSIGVGPLLPLVALEGGQGFFYSRWLLQGELHMGFSIMFWGGGKGPVPGAD